MFKFKKGQGSFVIDRRYKGIGRIRRASGTTNKTTYRQIVAMMSQLYQTGRHQILREIQQGTVTPLEAFGYWRDGKLEHIPTATTLKTLLPTVPDWIQTHSVGDTTKRNYTYAIKRLADLVGNVPIQEIPQALTSYKAINQEKGTSRTFNFTRTAVLAYLRAAYGKFHPLYQKVADIRQLEEVVKKQAPQLTVVEAVELIKALPTPHDQIARAMLFTGMHWEEVTNKWEVLDDRILIHGTKAKGRDRMVPLIEPDLQKPQRASKAFRTQLRKVRDELSPYSFRRSYAHWMAEAGIPRARRQMYLGHSGKDVTDLYERHQVDSYLQADADLMRKYITITWKERDTKKVKDTPRSIVILKGK